MNSHLNQVFPDVFSICDVLVVHKIGMLASAMTGADPGFSEGGFEFVRREKLGGPGACSPGKILKSGTSETPFPGLSGWIWGKKGGSTEPIDPPPPPRSAIEWQDCVTSVADSPNLVQSITLATIL